MLGIIIKVSNMKEVIVMLVNFIFNNWVWLIWVAPALFIKFNLRKEK